MKNIKLKHEINNYKIDINFVKKSTFENVINILDFVFFLILPIILFCLLLLNKIFLEGSYIFGFFSSIYFVVFCVSWVVYSFRLETINTQELNSKEIKEIEDKINEVINKHNNEKYEKE